MQLGGRPYNVQAGRRDALTASRATANKNIPSPLSNFRSLLSSFQSHGLNLKDLVLLSAAHTIGFARCTTFRSRIYNETTAIDASFASSVRTRCPPSGGDGDLSPLDSSAKVFDAVYLKGLIGKRGLLHSDQQLYRGDGSEGDRYVKYYSENVEEFWRDFGVSMLRMGNISPLTGRSGEIRKNCRKVNSWGILVAGILKDEGLLLLGGVVWLSSVVLCLFFEVNMLWCCWINLFTWNW